MKKLLIIATAIAAIAIAFVASASAAQPNQRVDLKVLLLTATGNEPTAQGWESTLKSEGVPYEKKIASADDPYTDSTFSDTLSDGTQHAKYQAVILATGGLYYSNPDGLWVSALSTEEWTALNAFEAKFGIRQLTAFAYPTPDLGLNYPTVAADMGGTTAALSTSGKLAFPYLKGTVKYDTGAYGYQATPVDATKFDTLITGPNNSSLLGINKLADGREDMINTVDSNQYQLHHLLLRHGMLSWLTRGAYLGYQRNYLEIHVDDVFLATERWDPKIHANNESVKPIRMTIADVARALLWQASTGIKLDMLFNGAGSVEAGKRDQLTAAMQLVKNQFRWVNHTYTHMHYDDVDENPDNGLQPPTTAEIQNDIKQNIDWGKSKGLPFLPSELVTGHHAGLHQPGMPSIANALGIKWMGSDNSIEPEPYSIGGAMTVPRYPTGVFYNVGRKAEQLDEYNYMYLPPELGGKCVNTSVTTCFSAPVTWNQYVDNNAKEILRHMMSNDVRPHYVHQANLAEDGTMYLVFNEAIARYNSYYKTPLTDLSLTEIGQQQQREIKWRNALAAGKVSGYIQNGKVTVQTTESIEVPFTGTTVGTVYGGQRSGWKTIAPTAAAVVTSADPANTVLPRLTGTATVGQVVTATTGTWTGAAPITYTYQWQRCNTAGVCSNIDGEKSLTHTITADDAGSKLRLAVMASNWTSSVSQVESAQTAVVK